jgi:hypothetical protein
MSNATTRSTRLSWQVTLYVTVTDPAALHRAALARYKQEGGDDEGAEDFIGTAAEPDISGCLRMLLDPGMSPDGININDSEAVGIDLDE